MANFLIKLTEFLCNAVWSAPTVITILSLGAFFTVKLKFFQIKYFRHILKSTIFSVFKNKNKNGLSPFQTLAVTLSATLGTGSIAGVATAIVSGGAGAVFWMWVSAFLGTAVSYVENILGVYFRERQNDGSFKGGAMYCFKNGFKNKKLTSVLGGIFAFSVILASFGIGNTVQTNTLASALNSANIGISRSMAGVVTGLLLFIIIFKGTGTVAKVSGFIMPVMAIMYLAGTLTIIIKNINNLPSVLSLIIRSAFGLDAICGGINGAMVKSAISFGVRRGIFSNEAGMGSTVLINSASITTEPAEQGMWGIFEVIFNTVIICSLTAFAVMSCGLIDLETGKLLTNATGALLVALAFKTVFGKYAFYFVAVLTVFFAFSTLLGWSFYGISCTEYLFGKNTVWVYKLLFSVSAYFGTVADLRFIWILSDLFNGIMIIPNLICIIALSPLAFKISENYIERKLYGNKYVPPLIKY